MNFQNTLHKVLSEEAKALKKGIKNQSETNLDEMIESILKIQGKLIVMGVGKSGLIGAKISATLSSTGTPSIFLHPTEALHGDLGAITKDDMILAISYSGESPELIAILPHLKRLGGKIITMSKDKDSSLSKEGDYYLNISVEKEACPLNIAPTSSTTLTLAIGDALSAALIKARNFTKENFASFHPGGALGKQLYVTIEDLMKTNNLPLVTPQTKLKEAIVIMSEGRLGNAVMVDADKKILGVLSDGDLRRAMMKRDFNLEQSVSAYATMNPKICNDKHILAYEALYFIEQNKIQFLIIGDKDGKILGVIHIHDLLSAGIKR